MEIIGAIADELRFVDIVVLEGGCSIEIKERSTPKEIINVNDIWWYMDEFNLSEEIQSQVAEWVNRKIDSGQTLISYNELIKSIKM